MHCLEARLWREKLLSPDSNNRATALFAARHGLQAWQCAACLISLERAFVVRGVTASLYLEITLTLTQTEGTSKERRKQGNCNIEDRNVCAVVVFLCFFFVEYFRVTRSSHQIDWIEVCSLTPGM
ncbi:unnamed protein product, partial [Discosporangium mesarthrocarpum]